MSGVAARWIWAPLQLIGSVHRAEPSSFIAGSDGYRVGPRRWGAVSLGGALTLGSGFSVDIVETISARDEGAAFGRIDRAALRWSGTRASWTIGRTPTHWSGGRIGSLLAGREAPPRWEIQGSTNRALQVPLPGLRKTTWTGSLFLAYLDDDARRIPDPLLFGHRLAWQPAPWIEVIGSRTILFGGEGRTEKLNLGDVANMLIGRRENLVGSDRGLGDSDQRASIAGRVRLDADDLPWLARAVPGWEALAGFYEYGGEDLLHPPLPSAVAHLHGGSIWWRGWRGEYDYAETVTGNNRWYGHTIYGPNAYRYRGFPLGLRQEADSRTLLLALWTPPGALQGRIERWEELYGEFSRNNERRVTWRALLLLPIQSRWQAEVDLHRSRRIGDGLEPRAPGFIRDGVALRLEYSIPS